MEAAARLIFPRQQVDDEHIHVFAAPANHLIKEMLSESEIATLSKRWRILSMLAEGRTQRDIVKELNVSLCKVTRGSKILKDKNSVITKYFMEDSKNGNTNNHKH